jgi:O-antigen/teichoic acid export membrane protein
VGGAVGIAVGVFALAAPLIQILFGAGYAPAIPILRILAGLIIPFTFNTYFSLAGLAARREQVIARSLAISLIVLSVLSAGWIRAAGLVGASWALLVAESAQTICFMLQRPPKGFRYAVSDPSR